MNAGMKPAKDIAKSEDDKGEMTNEKWEVNPTRSWR